MARTDEATVAEILKIKATVSVTPFITDANLMVTQHCTDSGYSDTLLTRIETWLAAHLYTLRERRRSTEKAGSVGASYKEELGLGLDQTVYGQQAKLLDYMGNLALLDKQIQSPAPAVGVTWLGKTADED